MNTFLTGQDITVAVPLVRDGEPFVADGSTIHWSLRDHDGSEEVAATTLVGVTDSTAYIVVGSSHNALSGGRKAEKRTLLVTGTVGTKPFLIQHVYRITEFLNLGVTESDVRAFLGVDNGELSDDHIDLVSAYLTLDGTIDLATELAGDNHRYAEQAIVAQAVLDLIPSLNQRISKVETDGTNSVTRFALDIADIEMRARAQLSHALTNLSAETPTTFAPVRFTVRTDPLTGV